MDPTTPTSPHGNLLPGYPVMSYQTTDPKTGRTITSGTPTAPNSVQYQQEVYEDGTTVVSKWSPEKNAWEPQSESVNSAIAARNNRENKPPTGQRSESQAELDAARAKEAAARTASISANTGVPAQRADIAQQRTASQVAADTARAAASNATAAKTNAELGALTAGKGTVPEFTPPSRRPGQKTDVAGVAQQYNTYRAQLQADAQAGKISWASASRQAQDYFDTNVQPALDAANKEANDAADELRQQTAAQHAASITSSNASAAASNASVARSGVLNETDRRRELLDEQKFGQTAGQDAIAAVQAGRAGKIFAGPEFGAKAAQQLNTFGKGGGPSWNASDFQAQAPPDYTAIAEAAATRALQKLGYTPSAAPGAQPPPGATPQPGDHPLFPSSAPAAAPAPTPAPVVPPYQPTVPPAIPMGASAA